MKKDNVTPDKGEDLTLTNKALMKKALGYVTKEVVEEFSEEEGEMVLKKKKVTKKSVPPDITAIKLVMDLSSEEDVELKELTDEELENEKRRLLNMLKENK